MKKFFYYLETKDEYLLFEKLESLQEEGEITYDVDDDILIIEDLLDDEELFDKLVKNYDLIEDLDYSDEIDDDYDDFYDDYDDDF
jgi:hypothetical protein